MEWRDDIYEQAKALTLATGKVSPSLIQRRFGILGEMEKQGVVIALQDGFYQVLGKAQP